MPFVNLLYIAKQHSSFTLQLVWRLWSGKLWKESLQRNILKLFYQKAMEFDLTSGSLYRETVYKIFIALNCTQSTFCIQILHAGATEMQKLCKSTIKMITASSSPSPPPPPPPLPLARFSPLTEYKTNGTIRFHTIQYDTMGYKQYYTIQYDTIKYKQYDTIHCNNAILVYCENTLSYVIACCHRQRL